MDVLASGYGLTEAPTWAPDGSLYFSDVTGGGVYRWTDGRVETAVPRRRGVGGIALHRDRGLMVSGRTLEHVRDGERRTILEPPVGLGFNDICAGPDGRVYAGEIRFNFLAGEEPVAGPVLRDDGAVVVEGLLWPNGLGFAPDGGTLYACDYRTGIVHAVTGGTQRAFATSPSGEADGLAVDEDGGVWIALGSASGIARFTPSGALDRVVDVPATFVTSLCFGGDDMRDLYVTTAARDGEPGAVLRGRSDVPGFPPSLAAV